MENRRMGAEKFNNGAAAALSVLASRLEVVE